MATKMDPVTARAGRMVSMREIRRLDRAATLLLVEAGLGTKRERRSVKARERKVVVDTTRALDEARRAARIAKGNARREAMDREACQPGRVDASQFVTLDLPGLTANIG